MATVVFAKAFRRHVECPDELVTGSSLREVMEGYFAMHPGTRSYVLDELGAFASGLGKPVIFTEAGYASQVGSTTAPWNWEISEERSDAEQAAGYEALFTAIADRSWIDGVQWWMWDDLADTGEDQTLDYTPHGKAAERVLRAQWAAGDEH